MDRQAWSCALRRMLDSEAAMRPLLLALALTACAPRPACVPAACADVFPDATELTPDLAAACRELLEGGVFELGARANQLEARAEALEVQCLPEPEDSP
jgi:hypothetical protein